MDQRADRGSGQGDRGLCLVPDRLLSAPAQQPFAATLADSPGTRGRPRSGRALRRVGRIAAARCTAPTRPAGAPPPAAPAELRSEPGRPPRAGRHGCRPTQSARNRVEPLWAAVKTREPADCAGERLRCRWRSRTRHPARLLRPATSVTLPHPYRPASQVPGAGPRSAVALLPVRSSQRPVCHRPPAGLGRRPVAVVPGFGASPGCGPP